MSHEATEPSGIAPTEYLSSMLSPSVFCPEAPPFDPERGVTHYRNRVFFLGDSGGYIGGNRTGGYNPSLAYFCKHCGRIWGRVILGSGGWHCVTIPCAEHGNGSFLTPLLWWDWPNGKTLDKQLPSLPPGILRHEAKIRASKNWKGSLA